MIPRSSLLWLALPLMALALAAPTRADDDDSDTDRRRRRRATAYEPAGLALYREECGACHLAYPPRFLPERSWTALLGGLEDHFGDNAALDEETRRTLATWLGRYAAAPDARAPPPLRITALPSFRREHRRIDEDVWRRRSVVSRANCIACHRGAERWDFDDDNVRIPRP